MGNRKNLEEPAETLDQATEYSQSALVLMGKRRIVPHARNYTIWYSFFSGKFPELVETIEQLVSHGQDISEKMAGEIFERFFGNRAEREAVSEVGKRIESGADRIVKIVGEASAETTRYGEALHTMSGQLIKADRIEDLREAVASISKETHHMEAHQRKLEKALGDSAQEIDDLRKKLKNVSRAARTDALTDLANRKYFAKRLREAAKEATETKNPLALLMLDVDNFKEVNDNWGHLVGDHVLRLISKTLVESIKGRDLAARYGGDEFAVVLPNTRLKDASTLAEQIRKTISTKKLSLKNTGESIRGITASIGVAAYRHGETLDELIHRADQALYSAKNDGRNRVATEAPLQALAAANS